MQNATLRVDEKSPEGVVKPNNTMLTRTIPNWNKQIYLKNTKPNIPYTNNGAPLGGRRLFLYSLFYIVFFIQKRLPQQGVSFKWIIFHQPGFGLP